MLYTSPETHWFYEQNKGTSEDLNWDYEMASKMVQTKVFNHKAFASFGAAMMWGKTISPFVNNPTRTIKIMTNEAGMKIFNEAIQNEFGSLTKKD